MRIMHLEFGRHLYGGAAQVRYLIEGLDDCGIENILICPVNSEISKVTCATKVVELSIGGDLDWRLPTRLKNIISLYEPSVVHAHSRRGADTVGGWVSRYMEVPAVLTRRVDNREAALWARLKYFPYDAVVGISSAVERELLHHVGLPAYRVHRVSSAMDTKRYSPATERTRLTEVTGLDSSLFTIGIVGQFISRKGHALLFECLPELFVRFPHARVLCFGQGPLENELKKNVLNKGLSSHVIFLGFRTDLSDLMPELDLLVHPARQEGLGVAVMEAMSSGVPVITSTAGGITDLLENKVHGLTFESGDKSGLFNAMVLMISDEELRVRFRTAARKRIQEQFSVEKMSHRYIEIYNQVLRSS
jgi:glycosyltransferase involved in cell wall biosynthesis